MSPLFLYFLQYADFCNKKKSLFEALFFETALLFFVDYDTTMDDNAFSIFIIEICFILGC